MAELAKIIDEKRNNIPYEKFARELDMTTGTLFKAINEDRKVGIATVRKLATWAKKNNDIKFAKQLSSYALGYDLAELS